MSIAFVTAHTACYELISWMDRAVLLLPSNYPYSQQIDTESRVNLAPHSTLRFLISYVNVHKHRLRSRLQLSELDIKN